MKKKLILLSLAACYFPMPSDIVSSPLRTFAFQFGMGWSVLFLAMTTKPNKTSFDFQTTFIISSFRSLRLIVVYQADRAISIG